MLQRDLTQQQHLETDGVLSLHGISWINYMGFGVDNIDVNLGSRNSMKTRVKETVHPATSWVAPVT